jgi:hypothetical protein
MTSQPMHLRHVGSSQIASTCHHDIHYPAMHMYLIMCTPVTSHLMHSRPVGSSQIATTCPQDIHYPVMTLYHTKLVLEVIELHPRQWLGQHICNLLLSSHVLEPHYPPLHHIPDIVIFDLDMLQPVMEHRIL